MPQTGDGLLEVDQQTKEDFAPTREPAIDHGSLVECYRQSASQSVRAFGA
jgi:hypothetical protein